MSGRIQEQISENPRRSQEFSPARELSQALPSLSPGYDGMENMFYFFYKIIIFRTKRKTIYEAYMYTLIPFINL